jgi:uncharacterized OsmC-like protein
VQFGPDLPLLRADEPAPLGQGTGPSPVQLLAASVGNCLSASLLFAWRKFKQEPGPITCDVQAEVGRNAEGRMRVLGLQATLTWAWRVMRSNSASACSPASKPIAR